MFRSHKRHFAVILVLLITSGLSFIDAGAQGRRRRSRRPTRPAVATPSPTPSEDQTDPTDPSIISTAEPGGVTTTKGTSARPKPSPTPTPETETDQLRRTITDLSGQVNKLTDKLGQMEDRQRSLLDLERLSRAEQRAETFRSQLRDVQAKETDLQGQLDQIDYALLPEQIERSAAMFGTMHPEVIREQRKKQLENQRVKVKAQLDQLEQSRVRLESAVTTADAEVDRLQRLLEVTNSEANDASSPSPSPTPQETPPLFR
ncbi:MAG TPA: hypothetical protein VGN86_08670 [Pyrinomonadaceae bacterium]|jgi:chromosome segregation ATPase|nr:hypothetical protein [Pyrinomonadaceae bacterium]